VEVEKMKPQIMQIILALSSWLLALSKQQTQRALLPSFSLRVPKFCFIFSCLFLTFYPSTLLWLRPQAALGNLWLKNMALKGRERDGIIPPGLKK